jgi:hypothetical protein
MIVTKSLTDNWTWIAADDGKLLGSIIASPLHNKLVLLERLQLEEGTPGAVGLLLFKTCVQECFLRGYTGFLTMIDPTRELERRLMAVARKRYGCFVSTAPFILVAGSTIGKLTQEERDAIHIAYSSDNR